MSLSRREFLGSVAAGAATFTFVPGRVLGQAGQTPPSEKLNIAGVGVGGMGGNNIKAVASENIVALCDVDDAKAAKTFETYPGAKRFRDYRKMLDAMDKEIDAVIVATPDHTHAVVAMECIKRGKHVYVQKPLTRTVAEARALTEAARKYKVVTQMGNQGGSSEEVRLICEWIWDGSIGPVREVLAWTNRPVWPQGMDRPADTPAVPATLDWDLWLGPAPNRPYHPAYHPFNWRAWQDFGTGALGDQACHLIDPVFRALKLRYPTSVEGSVAVQYKEMWKAWQNTETFPLATLIHYEFPARGDMPAVKLHWYDGGIMPQRPEELEKGRRMGDSEGGVLFVGDKGKLMCGNYAQGPRLIPDSRMKEYQRPARSIPRVGPSHEMHWVECCKKGGTPSSHFDYAGPFTESVVMGNLAIRFPNRQLLWDGEAMKVTNLEEANALVNPPYREGWSL
jgi:predicted dehydrogenase